MSAWALLSTRPGRRQFAGAGCLGEEALNRRAAEEGTVKKEGRRGKAEEGRLKRALKGR